NPYADQGDAAKRIVLRGRNDHGPARRPALSHVDAPQSGRPDARGAWLSRYLVVRAEPDLAQASRQCAELPGRAPCGEGRRRAAEEIAASACGRSITRDR